ncbi:alpha-glucosidase [Sphingorhabdus lutea]|uniref:Alpha-glucosidase n=2 Tax=Sphingorhabdus lutea TaxID=1913578 RepID=A0A1L3JAQ1_9SPHN|nr:alpha-glucosidase [Sphingorhabdus lutea]
MKVRKFKTILAVIMVSISLPQMAWGKDIETIKSPDEKAVLTISLDGDGRISYRLDRNGAAIIAPSKMGFLLTDNNPLNRGFTMISSQKSTVDEQWELPWGERQFVTNNHNEISIIFKDNQLTGNNAQNGDGRTMTLRFRLFNNGLGFRYELPKQNGLQSAKIADELTEFNIAQNGDAWWIQAGDWNRYEYLYQKSAINAVSTAHSPISMKLTDGTYIAFHEAALVDYSAMWLKRMEGNNFRATLSPSPSGPKVLRDTPFTTPWRTIRFADNAPGLYDNDLELNLNEPNKLGDVSWFKPHKYIGIWWEMHLDGSSWASGAKHGATTQNAIKHIDFAAKHGFRGILIEGWNKGWDGQWFGSGRDFSFTEAYDDFDLKKVTDYARKKGVHIIGHHETGGNIKIYEAQLSNAMKLYASLGIDAVKTGYVADAGGIIGPGENMQDEAFYWHDGQKMAQHHLKVVEEAAKNKIAVNPHEPIKDTGLRRTYPNWVSREGARGMEYQAWGEPANIPEHVPNLIFTRMLSGPMDYTPGVFSLKGKNGRDIESTLARQLALYLVIYSPIQMAADLPENLAAYPDALGFVEKVPVDWKETITLMGEIGDYAVQARQDKASKNWFVGGVTDEHERMVNVALSFLEAGRKYRATIYRDGDGASGLDKTRHNMVKESKIVESGDLLKLRIAPAGGFAIQLEYLP